tara:strand:- start:18081 stop:18560 length:480 start_codon:yes stop_codon:yes gene_type:complete
MIVQGTAIHHGSKISGSDTFTPSRMSYGYVLAMQNDKSSVESTGVPSARVASNNSDAVGSSQSSARDYCSVLKRSCSDASNDAEVPKNANMGQIQRAQPLDASTSASQSCTKMAKTDARTIFGNLREPHIWVCAFCRVFKSQDEGVVQKHEDTCKVVIK